MSDPMDFIIKQNQEMTWALTDIVHMILSDQYGIEGENLDELHDKLLDKLTSQSLATTTRIDE